MQWTIYKYSHFISVNGSILFSYLENVHIPKAKCKTHCLCQWTALECVAFKFALSHEHNSKSIIKCSGGDFYTGLLKRECYMPFHALCPGSLQIWYHLQTDRSPDVFSPALNNLADGRLHRIRIHRVGKNLYVQVGEPSGTRLYRCSHTDSQCS